MQTTEEQKTKLIEALLIPVFDTMQNAGIARISIDGNNAVVQLNSGEVISVRPCGVLKQTLGKLIAWSVIDLGEAATYQLLNELHGQQTKH